MFFLIIASSILALARTTSLEPKFNSLPSIAPGSSAERIKEIFGKPNDIQDLKKFSDPEPGFIWEYVEEEGKENFEWVRLSVTVDPSSKALRGWSWAVVDKEAERDLKTAMGKFPSAKWTADMPKWANPHQVPMECYYNDRSLGITIEYSRVKNQVTRISRWDPTRGLASDKEDKPPRYCIDSFCSDAPLSKDIYKDPKHPLCELPK